MNKKFIFVFIVPIVLLGIGTIGFHYIEKLSFIDSLYLTSSTITTVGYGDIHPKSSEGKIFSLFIMFGGIGIVLSTLTYIVNFIVEGELKNIYGGRKMEASLKKMRNHYIICGYGNVGERIAKRLRESKRFDIIVIEKNKETCEKIKLTNIPFIDGDATDEKVLLEAGIINAKGLVTTILDDAENVYIVITARSLNSNLHIVARGSSDKVKEKLYRIGANRVIMPDDIGARIMAESLTRPYIVDFVDSMTEEGDINTEFISVKIGSCSKVKDMTIKETKLGETYGAFIIYLKRNEKYLNSPRAETKIEEGDILTIRIPKEYEREILEFIGAKI
ncbi:MAG: Calcium-gated potassium channel MthK [Candidatus Methanofastidiosum methylothiophilum]|uniref:Calcium-gated potassium channel MthK n=1 Tax=Candidatus Methanofastidiosum methylothiophilum TaxID=1705564 RepID=A0A150IQA4_9EURY|nr:MAG: Calcium-gated potassium channel MthK [Candidatus Methanofastidiosum methylthiophilus]KYC47140.1 MAG: Calcium-gated potassium channel MthK [Candidatus Methanofastidiosum methylthiophilus]KYC49556.1 MAG: Calcium-gated potassium channel MthK [Candidatus Methanofastidiosum methylthiophilus]